MKIVQKYGTYGKYGCFVLVVGIGVLVGGQLEAQSLDQALQLYKDKAYADAAFGFYDVLQNDPNPDRRDQAEIYLAESLRKSRLLVPALFYYTDLFKAGRTNRFYLNAVEGLLRVQEDLHDVIWVPNLINEYLDAEGFGQLDPDRIAQINYLIGELSFRQGKNQDAALFLEYVPSESPLRNKALFLRSLLAVRAKAPQNAQVFLENILKRIEPTDTDDESARIRNLALIALARNAYGMGQYEQATQYYRTIPRFSDAWFTALYENAWAHFRKEEYGKALGEIESVMSPYFAKRHVPEAYVLRATAYFANCQWDRVRRTIVRFKDRYATMLSTLKSYLGEAKKPGAYYDDVVATGAGHFADELAREVRRIRRFKDYHYMLKHMQWERAHMDTMPLWIGTRLAKDMRVILETHQDGTKQVAGMWAKRRLRELLVELEHFQAQINILDFEVADAERNWLEQGKEILKGRRARLPRPDIPNDQWQHWGVGDEYWKDEIGFVQHTLQSECF